MLPQQRFHVGVSLLQCAIQRRHACFVFCVDVGVGGNQNRRGCEMPLFSRLVERRVTAIINNLHIRPVIDEPLRSS